MKKTENKTYKAIGYWHSEEQPGLPDPAWFKDNNWDKTEKQAVIDYLKKGETVVEYRGWSWCRFGCSGAYGSADLTDGTYIYPEGLVHYIEKHNVRLPVDFINHIYGKSEKTKSIITQTLSYFRKKSIESQSFGDIDYDWWLSQKGHNPHNLKDKNGSETILQSFSSQKEAMLYSEKHLDETIEHTLLDKSIIRELISNGNTEKVLLKLQQAGYPKATIFYEQYKEKAKLMQTGTLNVSDWYALQKQLYKDILTWEYLEETRAQILLTQAQKLHIRQLIKNNQTADALNFCKDLDDKPAILSGYYERIMKGRALNMLTESEHDAYLIEINEAFEELIA